MSKIRIENLYKIFGGDPQKAIRLVGEGVDKQTLLDQHQHVLGLQNINLELQARSIEVIMGLSGSGKSTLIRHINRLMEPTAGKIYIDGDDVTAMNRRDLRALRQHKISMVFQKFALMPHNTILENVQFGLTLRKGVSAKTLDERSRYWIERVGLKGTESQYPRQLSGGMQQRVGLARALTTDADILLMDEAFSALDPLIRTDMQNMLLELQRELNKTIIFITHDLDEALRIGDQIAILKDGALIQQGNAKDILMHPADDYVRRFVADVNRVKVLRVQAIMKPIIEPLGNMDNQLVVHQNETVESILPKVLLDNLSSVYVSNEQQDIIGVIDRQAIASTIGQNHSA